MKHYIFSETLHFESNRYVDLVRENPVDFVRKINKNKNMKTCLCGGGTLAGSLLDAGLINKLILKINPVILGEGIPFFGKSRRKVRLELIDLKNYDSGIIVPAYTIIYD